MELVPLGASGCQLVPLGAIQVGDPTMSSLRLPSYCLNTESGANIKDTYLRVCQEFVLLLAIDCSLQSPSLKVAARDRSEQNCNAEMSSLRLALNQHRERRAGFQMLTILTFCCGSWLTPLRTSDPSNALFQLPPSHL